MLRYLWRSHTGVLKVYGSHLFLGFSLGILSKGSLEHLLIIQLEW